MKTILVPEWLIDGTGAEPLRNHIVVVASDLIEQVLPIDAVESVACDQVLPLQGTTLLPGLINNHVHLILPGDDVNNSAYLEVDDVSDSVLAQRAEQNIESALRSGVTTVRDCGGRGTVVLSVRDAQRHGKISGARIISCGWPLTVAGGHLRDFGGQASGETALRRMILQLRQASVDFIKVVASGGGTPGTSVTEASYSARELALVVEEAHHQGIWVSVHCIATSSIERAVEAGVDLIEHCSFVAPDGKSRFEARVAEKLVNSGIPITPTLQVSCEMLDALPERQKKQQEEQIDRRREIMAMLHQMGVTILAGSDAGWRNTQFDTFWKELAELANCGLTPVEVVHCATGAVAHALGYSDRFGTIVPGRSADLVAVRGDVGRDIHHLANPVLVMQEGNIRYRSFEGTDA